MSCWFTVGVLLLEATKAHPVPPQVRRVGRVTPSAAKAGTRADRETKSAYVSPTRAPATTLPWGTPVRNAASWVSLATSPTVKVPRAEKPDALSQVAKGWRKGEEIGERKEIGHNCGTTSTAYAITGN